MKWDREVWNEFRWRRIKHSKGRWKMKKKKKKEKNLLRREKTARFLRIVSNFLRPSFERTKLSSLIDGGDVEV